MTMNLDVSIRLLDGLTRPAADADRAIARIGKTAERVATRVRSLATASRGLASAVRDLKAADERTNEIFVLACEAIANKKGRAKHSARAAL